MLKIRYRSTFRYNIHKGRKLAALFVSLLTIGIYFILKSAYNTGDTKEALVYSADKSTLPNVKPFFHKSHNFSCGKIFAGDTNESKQAQIHKRPVMKDYDWYLKLYYEGCPALYNQFYWPRPHSETDDSDLSVAYSILIDTDLDYFIRLLHGIYAADGTYCIHVDLKGPRIIFEAAKIIASCLNRFGASARVSEKSEAVTWNGYGMLQATINCLEILEKAERPWKYAFLLQGKDFPLKSVPETKKILKLLDGANDVELRLMKPERLQHLYVEETDDRGLPSAVVESKQNFIKDSAPFGIQPYKGSYAAILNRDFVRYMLYDKKAIALRKWLNGTQYPDEGLWSTLNHNQQLGIPGSYPGTCLTINNRKKDWITRFALWYSEPGMKCFGEFHHTVCLLSCFELPALYKRPEIFLNKFRHSNDPVALDCMHEFVTRRRFHMPLWDEFTYVFDATKYVNLSAVRFQKWRKSKNTTKKFEC